jgi:tetratricopeptide (TPR) repeat protein
MKSFHIKANQLYNIRKYIKAIELYSKLIDSNYEKATMLSNRSACYLNLKNYLSSLADSLKAIEININMVKAWGRVGYSYKGLEMHKDAYKAFEIANTLDKNNDLYKNELQYYFNRFNNKINLSNIFKLLTSDIKLLNNLKEIKTDIINTTPTNLFNNKKIINFIETIIKKID